MAPIAAQRQALLTERLPRAPRRAHLKVDGIRTRSHLRARISLFAGSGKRSEQIREHAHRSMSPVWEANHVWLIFVLTVFWTSYPRAFGSIASKEAS